jgi:very-short-patch-repair endonuclease
MTAEEVILWNHLKNSELGYKFRRQASIGYYIADFYCPRYRYIIELDGSQHIENSEYDQERDNFLRSKGCTVRRFWNNKIHTELQDVVTTIRNDLDNLKNSTTPPYGHPS